MNSYFLKTLLCLVLFVCFEWQLSAAEAPTDKPLLQETFQEPLSKDWFWGLGTWKAEKGILRGYESGPRRHGPVKMRRFELGDGIVDFEFRLEGKARFAGIIFNGSQQRGHIVHLVISQDQIRVLGHAKKAESENLLQQPHKIETGKWYPAQVRFDGPSMTATVDGRKFTVKADYIAEPKLTFGLGGDSGGPAGEKAGALEFRNLKISSAPTVQTSLSEAGRAEIRSEIQAVIDEGYYPGISILLIHRGQVVMREAHGVVDVETKKPFTVDQLCWLASTGKLFTATLMASLADEGLLTFDDPIAKTWPAFADIRLSDESKPRDPVRLRHALSHTSGIPNDNWLKAERELEKNSSQLAGYVAPQTAEDFINACLKLGLVVEPGTKMLYGRPIDLTACVAEKVTGNTFITLMQERVFQPLGLQHTTIQPTPEELKQLAPLYSSTKPGVFEPDQFGLEVAVRQNKGLSTAGGGVYSTLDDLGTLMQLHLNRGKHAGKQLIRAETLELLYQPQPGTNGRYGLAFQIKDSQVNGHSRILSHPGYSGPVAWIDFERDLAGVLLMQSNTVQRTKHHNRIIDTIYRYLPAQAKSD